MNLLHEDFFVFKENKTKKTIKIVVICIVIVLIAIIGIVAYMVYLDSTQLKVVINGQQNADVKNLLITESDGTIYVPVRAISSYLGYNCYNGEYNNKSESTSKSYVECEGEVANLTLNSNKIYKLNLQNQDDGYTYVYMDKPVIARNGELYITTDGMQKVFNTTFQYDTQRNIISIYTSAFLVEQYNVSVLDFGYTQLSENFENNKAVVRNMLVVTDDQNYGVINATDGTEILECKYDDIIYQESTGDFIVSSNGKYGIMGADKKTKVDINYDDIKLMDYDAGLYLVERDNKYGVIDLNGNTKIYAENDEIGIDISQFAENDLKTGYILVDNLIPVKKGEKWGLFDKNGNQVVEFEYDSFGYIANDNREAVNLLVIPSYNVIVACIDDRYTLLNSSGKQPFGAFVDDIYMTINGGEKSYKMIANDREYDVEEYLDRLGVRSTSNSESSNSTSSNTTNTTRTNTTTNNETNDDTNDTNGTTDNTTNEENNGEENRENVKENNGETENQENNEGE